MLNQSEKMAIAQSPLVKSIIDLMRENKTQIGSLIGEDSFQTTVNAVTVETEAMFIARFEQFIEDIKLGNFHD